MWLLAGLDRPDTGDVLFKGQPFGRMSNGRLAALRAGHIGLIFQNFNLVTSWTALENIAAPLELKGLEPSEVRARSVALLSTLGLEDRLDNLPAELSVGQQQRVAVARTLITKPSLILADEPTGDVDPETATEIAHLLFAEVKERGATLIVATHGHFPCQGVNRVLSLKNGQLV